MDGEEGVSVRARKRVRVRVRARMRQIPVFAVLLMIGIFCIQKSESSLKYSSELFGKALSLFHPISASLEQEEGTKENWLMQIFPVVRYGQTAEEKKSKLDAVDPSYQEYLALVGLYEEISMKHGMGEQTLEIEDTESKTSESEILDSEILDSKISESDTIHSDTTESEAPESNTTGDEIKQDITEPAKTETSVPVYAGASGRRIVLPYSMEQLADYDFLIQKVYNIHSSTTASREIMNAETFLEKDFSLKGKNNEPQILIYHSHSQETYLEEGAGEDGASVVALGKILTENLENRGYYVIHDTSVYDLKDGKLDRSKAYTYALEGVQAILTKYPSIEVVIDLHRDGVPENVHLVSEIDGKQTAQLMFFNGMSQTPTGPIAYLENPYREDNLAFSFQLQMEAMSQYPGLTRKIFLKGLRYNLHVRQRSLLIEAGAQNNTFEEAKNAMEPLADILDQVLKNSGT